MGGMFCNNKEVHLFEINLVKNDIYFSVRDNKTVLNKIAESTTYEKKISKSIINFDEIHILYPLKNHIKKLSILIVMILLSNHG